MIGWLSFLWGMVDIFSKKNMWDGMRWKVIPKKQKQMCSVCVAIIHLYIIIIDLL